MKIGDVVTLADTTPIGKGFKVKVTNVRINWQNEIKFFCVYPHDDNNHGGVSFGLEFDYGDLIEDKNVS